MRSNQLLEDIGGILNNLPWIFSFEEFLPRVNLAFEIALAMHGFL